MRVPIYAIIIYFNTILLVYAQNPVFSGDIHRIDPDGYYRTNNNLDTRSLYRTRLHPGLNKFVVAYPEGLSLSDRRKINDLVEQIKNICPECSTAGSFGGAVATGGNLGGTGNVLFGDDDPCPKLVEKNKPGYITIKKKEYDELVRKANLYDRQKR